MKSNSQQVGTKKNPLVADIDPLCTCQLYSNITAFSTEGPDWQMELLDTFHFWRWKRRAKVPCESTSHVADTAK